MFAARTQKTLTAVIKDALRESLARHKTRRKPTQVTLPTFKGEGLRRGIDLDDTAGLLDVMDGKS